MDDSLSVRCPLCGTRLVGETTDQLCRRCLDSSGLGDQTLALPAEWEETNDETDDQRVPDHQAEETAPPSIPRPTPSVSSLASLPDGTWIFEQIGQGGMGTVLKGHDPSLGRDLAIKMLRDHDKDHPSARRRFIEEAQITGQLQHPGIVPVYHFGKLEDECPYFSMKLVKGRTLASLLEERSTPSEGTPGFLSIFESVCQTMAYAHSRRVVHRDLKPSNVMVGAFGEVLVLDWGIAKSLAPERSDDPSRDEAAASDLTVIATRRQVLDDPDLTQPGRFLGTPAYASPEQARGDLENLDERSDVFALGSILCHILTGAPAFRGAIAQVLVLRATQGDVEDAFERLDDCGADDELVDLAKACLAPDRDHRPRDAGVVARQISDYLASVQEKLRSVEWERVEAQARAEEETKRRVLADQLAVESQARALEENWRRRMTLALAAAMLALVVMGGGGYSWYAQQRAARHARLDGLIQQIDTAVNRAETTDQADSNTESEHAQILLGQAWEVASEGATSQQITELSTLQGRAERARSASSLLSDLEQIHIERTQSLTLEHTDSEYARAFRKAGLDLDLTDPQQAGASIAQRRDAVEIASYLDEWSFIRRAITGSGPESSWSRLVEVAKLADPDPWRNHLRTQSLNWKSESARSLDAFAEDETILNHQPTASLVLLASQLKELAGNEAESQRVLERAWCRSPNNFRVNLDLARIPRSIGKQIEDPLPRSARTLRYLMAAVALRPDNAAAHAQLGLAQCAESKLATGMDELRAAIRLRPDLVVAHVGLGIALERQGRLDEALASLRTAEKLVPPETLAAQGIQGLAWQLEARAVLLPRLQAVLDGREVPRTPTEALLFGELLEDQQRYAAAAKLLFAMVNHTDKLTGDLVAQLRHEAARAAVLAGLGTGKDQPPPDASAREHLRRQALEALQAEVAASERPIPPSSPSPRSASDVRRSLEGWWSDPDLAGVRETSSLAKLPDSERHAWLEVWAEVNRLMESTKPSSESVSEIQH